MKRLLKKHWPLIGIVILIIVVSFYLFKAKDEIIKKPILAKLDSEEGLKLKNIHYTQDDPDEGVKWTLDAKEVKFSKDRQIFSFRNFRLKLEPENRPSMELAGENGDYDKNSGEINLRGDLKGSTDNGYRITANHLLYQQKEGYLKTEEPIIINGPFFSVTGKGLYFNLNQGTLRITSDVTTRIKSELSNL